MLSIMNHNFCMNRFKWFIDVFRRLFFFFFNPSFWGLMDLEIPLLHAEQESWNRQTMTIRRERPVFVFLPPWFTSCISKFGSHFTNVITQLWHNLLVRFWHGEKKTVHAKELRKVGEVLVGSWRTGFCRPTLPLPYAVPWMPHILQSKFCSQMASTRDASVPWNKYCWFTALPPFLFSICSLCLTWETTQKLIEDLKLLIVLLFRKK